MIRHIVILYFDKKYDRDYLGLLEYTRPLVVQIPGVVKYSVFGNQSKYVPENVISVGVEIFFEDEAALNLFMNHPKHYEANSLFEKYLVAPGYMVLTHEVDALEFIGEPLIDSI